MGVVERLEYRDIEGLRVGRFGSKINTTSILWRLGETLIDTGPPNQWPVVRQFARQGGVRLAIATHHHEDHAGNLSRLPDLGINDILAPRESLDWLENGFPLETYRRVVWGRPGKIRARPLPPSLDLPDGTRIQALLLPGHSPDMTCLLDSGRGVLFAADLYVGSRLRYLRADENLDGILEALRNSLAFDFDTLLCSHRGVVPNGRQKLEQKLAHLSDLKSRARTLHRAGTSLPNIVRRLLGKEDFVSAVSRGHFSKRNLIAACLSSDGSTLL